MSETLRIGDRVMWRGGWGNHAARPAQVVRLTRCAPGEKEGGHEIDAAPWALVVVPASGYVVDLDNGHWAYGEQLRPAVRLRERSLPERRRPRARADRARRNRW